MIVRQYLLYCDGCGRYISTIETTSIEKAVRLEKKSNRKAKITKRVNGAYYIECADCARRKNEQASF